MALQVRPEADAMFEHFMIMAMQLLSQALANRAGCKSPSPRATVLHALTKADPGSSVAPRLVCWCGRRISTLYDLCNAACRSLPSPCFRT